MFTTRGLYGLWVLGDAGARVRAESWKTLEFQVKQNEPDTLFPRVRAHAQPVSE